MKKRRTKESWDPFDLSLEEYFSLSDDQQWALTQKLYECYGDWIQQQLQETGAALLVLCNRKVIYSSPDRYDFRADEVVAQTQQERKKPCFILTRPVLAEEMAAWSDLGQGDHYPTLEAISDLPLMQKMPMRSGSRCFFSRAGLAESS